MDKARPSDQGHWFTFTPITRSPAQESACKDLGRNDQDRVITPKATYTPTPNRAGSRSLSKFGTIGQGIFHLAFLKGRFVKW